ncbi:MAG: aldehyde dehydrogenase [Flavobacteriaceae bacterium]|nr:aldehyde dehydrogenase [Flavobacteriaceae bacterium]MBT6448893.1 aldehyde dehydrogenase [Flavobacteriaceae bacterium]
MKDIIKNIINKQRVFFNSKKTFDIQRRKELLKNLKKEIENNEKEIENALFKDLGKSEGESYLTELHFIYSELNIAIKNIDKWVKRKSVRSSLLNFPSSDYIIAQPYGITLHISPWNYPFQLSIAPLIGAIAAGNTVILKPSEYSINTSLVLEKIIDNVFPEDLVKVIQGGPEEANELLNYRWDYIFFTGSLNVGKIVAEKAAKFLTPTTLELGGKNPCIIDETASIKVTAKRIVWGKFINCGQTCIAPDFLIVNEKIKNKLVNEIINQIKHIYGDDAQVSDSYGRIISKKHIDFLSSLLNNENIIYGGKIDSENKYFEPTLVEITDFNSNLMKQEIFGPILPIYKYKDFNEIDEIISRYKDPLALYIFTKKRKFGEKFLNNYSFGGGAINDTVVHIANDRLPFGGVGNSGMGKYHGESTFKTFSHFKPYISKPFWIDLPLRYPPFKKKISFLKKVLKLIE